MAPSNGFFAAIHGMNWLYHCVLLFVSSIAVMIVSIIATRCIVFF